MWKDVAGWVGCGKVSKGERSLVPANLCNLHSENRMHVRVESFHIKNYLCFGCERYPNGVAEQDTGSGELTGGQ